MKRYKFTLLDICLPDYFNGYSGPVLAVPVDGSTTKEGLTELIIQEYNSFECERLPELDNTELEGMCDSFILMDKPFSGSITVASEHDMDTTYLYFTVNEK